MASIVSTVRLYFTALHPSATAWTSAYRAGIKYSFYVHVVCQLIPSNQTSTSVCLNTKKYKKDCTWVMQLLTRKAEGNPLCCWLPLSTSRLVFNAFKIHVREHKCISTASNDHDNINNDHTYPEYDTSTIVSWRHTQPCFTVTICSLHTKHNWRWIHFIN